MKNILALSICLLLTACATVPASKDISSTPQLAPSYFEAIKAESLQSFKSKTVCPKSESAFAQSTWRQMTNMAAACVKVQDWSRVEQLGNSIAIKGRLTPWGPYYMALSAEARKDFPRAIWMMELALKKAPSEGILHYELGRIRWLMGDDFIALKSLKSASELNPSLTEAHWVTGMIALNGEKFSEATAAFNRALAKDSQHWPSVMSLTEVYMRSKDWQRAEVYLNKAIGMNSRSTHARVVLAYVLEMQLKKTQEALDTYKDLRRLSAGNKLDAPLNFNVEEKIKDIEGSLAKALKPQVSSRQPSNDEKKVAK